MEKSASRPIRVRVETALGVRNELAEQNLLTSLNDLGKVVGLTFESGEQEYDYVVRFRTTTIPYLIPNRLSWAGGPKFFRGSPRPGTRRTTTQVLDAQGKAVGFAISGYSAEAILEKIRDSRKKRRAG